MPSAGRPGRAVPFQKLALVAAVFILLASAGAWIAYRRLIHYERRAALHLPDGTDFAGRVDVERIVLFEPVRRHLLPLINELPLAPGQSGAADSSGPDRLHRLRRAAGLNLGLDLREIAFASVGRSGAWALVFGGLFADHGLLTAIEQLLRAEGSTALRRQGDVLVFQPWGTALAQARDGVLVLADSPATLESALPVSHRLDALGLPRDGAAGVAISTPRLRDALRSVALGSSDTWLQGIERLVATASIGQDVEVEVSARIAPNGTAGRVAAAFDSWRQSLPTAAGSGSVSADWAEEWGLLARAKSPSRSENSIEFETYWRRPELDRSARNLANWLERRILPHGPERTSDGSSDRDGPSGNWTQSGGGPPRRGLHSSPAQ